MHHLNRRQLLQLAALVGGAAALAACGGPAVGEAGGAATEKATDWAAVTPAKEITWWSNHPGTSKDFETRSSSGSRPKPASRSTWSRPGPTTTKWRRSSRPPPVPTTCPDLVIASDVWWFRYMINGQILPLDQLAKHLEFDTADFNTTLYGDYEFTESHWAVPYARSTPLFYYNKAVWEKAGLPTVHRRPGTNSMSGRPRSRQPAALCRWAWAREPPGLPGGSATCSGAPAAPTPRTGP